MPPDRIHKAGTHLHADGIDKQDQAEFLYKVENVGFNAEPQVSKQNAHEKGPRPAKANPLDLDFSDHEADCRRKGNHHDLLPYRGLRE